MIKSYSLSGIVSFVVMSSPPPLNSKVFGLSQSRLVTHLWTDKTQISSLSLVGAIHFAFMSSSSPLNGRILRLVASQSVMSSLLPLNWQISKHYLSVQ